MNIKQLLGKRIRELRKSQKYTQEKVAELIGIETVSFCNIENGKYYPTAENLEKITKVLNATPKVLFDFEKHQEPQDLLNEINLMLQNNPERIPEFYKILKALIN